MPVPLVFAHRHIAYKIASGVLVLAALLAIFGVISPGWYYNVHVDTGASSYSHLWISCQDGLSNCHGVSSGEGFEVAAQVFSCIGLLVIIAACFLAVFLNFLTQNSAHNRWLEITVFVGGGILFLGALTFAAGGTKKVNKPLEIVEIVDIRFGYALAMTFTAAILVLLAGGVIFVFNRPIEVASEMTSLSGAQRHGHVNGTRNVDDDDSTGGFERNGQAPHRPPAPPVERSYNPPPYIPPQASAPHEFEVLQPQHGGYYNYGLTVYDDEEVAEPSRERDLGEPTPALNHAPVRYVRNGDPAGRVHFGRPPDGIEDSRQAARPPPTTQAANRNPRGSSQLSPPSYETFRPETLPSRGRLESAPSAAEWPMSRGLTSSGNSPPARREMPRSASVDDDRLTTDDMTSHDYATIPLYGTTPLYANMPTPERSEERVGFVRGHNSSSAEELRSHGAGVALSGDRYRPSDYRSNHLQDQHQQLDRSEQHDSVRGVPPPPYTATDV